MILPLHVFHRLEEKRSSLFRKIKVKNGLDKPQIPCAICPFRLYGLLIRNRDDTEVREIWASLKRSGNRVRNAVHSQLNPDLSGLNIIKSSCESQGARKRTFNRVRIIHIFKSILLISRLNNLKLRIS
ncbi:hypothetical protein WG66_014400 [Moniliophthora roreri]|nr:hypothetical protein WG66_014400 [Moniliophthora roreri]